MLTVDGWALSCAGMYKGGEFLFTFTINSNYPHDPPKVKCVPKVSVVCRQSTRVYGVALARV